MRKIFKKIGDILFIIFLVSAGIAYALIAYALFDFLNIGVDGS